MEAASISSTGAARAAAIYRAGLRKRDKGDDRGASHDFERAAQLAERSGYNGDAGLYRAERLFPNSGSPL